MVLPAEQFIGRFLLHVLPRGFQKVRAFGWLSPKRKRSVLAAIRTQLRAREPPPAPTDASPAEFPFKLHSVTYIGAVQVQRRFIRLPAGVRFRFVEVGAAGVMNSLHVSLGSVEIHGKNVVFTKETGRRSCSLPVTLE